jgi:hypothetical protein
MSEISPIKMSPEEWRNIPEVIRDTIEEMASKLGLSMSALTQMKEQNEQLQSELSQMVTQSNDLAFQLKMKGQLMQRLEARVELVAGEEIDAEEKQSHLCKLEETQQSVGSSLSKIEKTLRNTNEMLEEETNNRKLSHEQLAVAIVTQSESSSQMTKKQMDAAYKTMGGRLDRLEESFNKRMQMLQENSGTEGIQALQKECKNLAARISQQGAKLEGLEGCVDTLTESLQQIKGDVEDVRQIAGEMRSMESRLQASFTQQLKTLSDQFNAKIGVVESGAMGVAENVREIDRTMERVGAESSETAKRAGEARDAAFELERAMKQRICEEEGLRSRAEEQEQVLQVLQHQSLTKEEYGKWKHRVDAAMTLMETSVGATTSSLTALQTGQGTLQQHVREELQQLWGVLKKGGGGGGGEAGPGARVSEARFFALETRVNTEETDRIRQQAAVHSLLQMLVKSVNATARQVEGKCERDHCQGILSHLAERDGGHGNHGHGETILSRKQGMTSSSTIKQPLTQSSQHSHAHQHQHHAHGQGGCLHCQRLGVGGMHSLNRQRRPLTGLVRVDPSATRGRSPAPNPPITTPRQYQPAPTPTPATSALPVRAASSMSVMSTTNRHPQPPTPRTRLGYDAPLTARTTGTGTAAGTAAAAAQGTAGGIVNPDFPLLESLLRTGPIASFLGDMQQDLRDDDREERHAMSEDANSDANSDEDEDTSSRSSRHSLRDNARDALHKGGGGGGGVRHRSWREHSLTHSVRPSSQSSHQSSQSQQSIPIAAADMAALAAIGGWGGYENDNPPSTTTMRATHQRPRPRSGLMTTR